MDILIATGNPGKFREIVAVLGDVARSEHRIQWRSLSDIGRDIAEPVETGTTFLQNATLKARYYSKAAGMWALADDSGLEVDALGGEPGVQSAYYDPQAASLPREQRDRANNVRLLGALQGVPLSRRQARYRCVLALADGDRILATTDGTVEGVIVDEPRGTGGFGYDPYFLLPERNLRMAELPAATKNEISHRGVALRRMHERLAHLINV